MALSKIKTASIADTEVSTAKLADDAVTNAKVNDDLISGATELTSEPADTDEFLVSDAGTLKRIDYSLIKASGGGGAGSVDAWVNFNGTGTVAINGSGNVSSVTDNDVGKYTVNFSTNLSDANYCHLGGGSQQTGVGNNGIPVLFGTSKSTSSFTLVFTVGNSQYDNANINMAFVR